MGLDMYLHKRSYVQNWDYMKPEEKYAITVKLGGKKDKSILPERVSSIVEHVMYWRKANHIHAWFVDNVQGGTDDCGDYPVSREQLQELIDTCRAVLAEPSKAAELLPTRSGFFFGSTEVDEWYIKDTNDTVEALTTELARPKSGRFGADYIYHSSW